MPVNQITNVAGAATQTAPAYPGQVIMEFVNGTSAALTVGTLVQSVTFTATPASWKVIKSTTAADFKLVGIVVGGKAPGLTVPIGTVAQVCVEGICQANFKVSTVKGTVVIQSTATAGISKSANAVVAGKTIGWVLQTVTIATPFPVTKAWIYVHKM